MSKPPSRHLPLILVMVAISAALGLGFGEQWFSRHGAHVSRDARGESEHASNLPAAGKLSAEVLVYPKPRSLAPFLLQRAGGDTLVNADLRGTWTLAFFGFTHCPDVCPTALATMKQIEELSRKAPSMGGARKLPLKYLFVSVDPERDTPAVLGEYAGYFSPAIIAATAPIADVEKFARDVGVVFFKVPQAEGEYTIDHSMQMLLFDPDGNLHAMWRPPHIPPTMLDDIASLASVRGRG